MIYYHYYIFVLYLTNWRHYADILESSGIAWPNPTMWRRGPFNPSMPVPTQHPKEGAEAHLHSPRRQPSYNKATPNSSGHSSGIPGLSSVNSNVSTLLSSMPNTQALLQRGWSNAASVQNDPFNQEDFDPLAFLDWDNTNGPVGYTPNTVDTAKSTYNPASTRKSVGNRRIINSDISMPDFSLGNSNNQTVVPSALNFTSNGLEEPRTTTQGPKVPTNTPTTTGLLEELGIDVNRVGTPGSMWVFSNTDLDTPSIFQPIRHRTVTTTAETNKQSTLDTPPSSEFFNTNNISSDLATSLTHSLLNQPHPLPVHAANVPVPASEIKSRKENRGNHTDSLENTPTAEHIDMRRMSQPVFGNHGKESKSTSGNNSPPSTRSFSGVFSTRSASAGEFGHDLTNLTNLTNFTHSNTDSTSTGVANIDPCINNSGPAKDAKRPRHFTPASSKVIDDADEPRRGSPRVRLFEESN